MGLFGAVGRTMLNLSTIPPLFVVACASAPVVAGASAYQHFTYARQYVDGQVARYTYTEQRAGAPATVTALVRLTSVVHNGIGGERVQWVALSDTSGHDLGALARTFPAYELSLDPRATNALTLPRQPIPAALQGPVDDLLTFFVDLSGRVGIAKLHRIGASYTDPAPLTGNFASATAPVGRDVIQLTTTLSALSASRATFTSAYQPPNRLVLKPYRTWMSAPVCGRAPNNFQLVQRQGTRYVALWGCESFTATTVVDRTGGQIVSVSMANPLHLKGALCPGPALTGCTALPDTRLQRLVKFVRTA
jgi:hypothetical protein